MTPQDMKAKTIPLRSTNVVPDTARAYLLFAAALPVMLGTGAPAVLSGAIDAVDGSGLLGGRS